MLTLKPFLFKIAILLACGLIPLLPAQAKAPLALAFVDQSGAAHSLAEYRGRFVLLNLWATWCGPCVAEMPALSALSRDYKGRLTIVTVSLDSTGEAVSRFFSSRSLDGLTSFRDSKMQAFSALQIASLPTTFLLDLQGQQIARWNGRVEWGDKDVRAMLDKLLGASQPSYSPPGAKVITM